MSNTDDERDWRDESSDYIQKQSNSTGEFERKKITILVANNFKVFLFCMYN